MLLRKGYPDYPTRNIEYGDVITGLPVQSNSVAGVYCSHVLEHLALSDFRSAVRNVFTYLKPGGRFRIVVPDLEFLIRQYSADASPDAAMAFMRNAVLGEDSRARGVRSLPRRVFGRSKHLWMWDYKAMEKELAAAGFDEIRRARYNDSPDARFREVENPSRWENCLGIECRKTHR